jgi:hypothetical protein
MLELAKYSCWIGRVSGSRCFVCVLRGVESTAKNPVGKKAAKALDRDGVLLMAIRAESEDLRKQRKVKAFLFSTM